MSRDVWCHGEVLLPSSNPTCVGYLPLHLDWDLCKCLKSAERSSFAFSAPGKFGGRRCICLAGMDVGLPGPKPRSVYHLYFCDLCVEDLVTYMPCINQAFNYNYQQHLAVVIAPYIVFVLMLDLLHFVLRSRVACLWIGPRLALAARCG